ncbi:hypothetical protein KW782_03130 [Candidatus Parcubacteria bacterium]|nr:hypothetical protein [Candidatus Parcubacteria bacterium]
MANLERDDDLRPVRTDHPGGNRQDTPEKAGHKGYKDDDSNASDGDLDLDIGESSGSDNQIDSVEER